MDTIQIKQTIKRELPSFMRDDPEIRQLILGLARKQFADKQETESRFDQVLDELRREREENAKKWAENQAVLRRMQDESAKKWAENQAILRRMQDESEKKWAENQAANEKKWAENQAALRRMQDESAKKWAENQSVIDRMLKKYDTDIGGLGARWGIRTEQSFRNALASILEASFDVEVLNINEFDEEGYVFGRPDQVEMDIIIKNGMLIICEIKSSMGRSQMYTFGRKITFYEQLHQTKATRSLVISPWVTERAKRVAEKLGIEVYIAVQKSFFHRWVMHNSRVNFFHRTKRMYNHLI